MEKPTRRLEDIEPDIRPNLHVVGGDSNTNSKRANFKAIDNQESNPEKLSTDSIAEQEANGSNAVQGPWQNKVNGSKAGLDKSKGRNNFLKKKGPLIGISATLLIGAAAIASLLPTLLFQSVTAVLSTFYNAQAASMEIRSVKMEASKAGTTSGFCSTVVNIRCKYSTMSQKQVDNFKEAGIEPINGETTTTTEVTRKYDDGTEKSISTASETTPASNSASSGPETKITKTDYFAGYTETTKVTTVKTADKTIFGRYKPTGFKYKDKIVTPSEFLKMIKIDPEFRSTLHLAYNPKYAGLADKIWQKVLGRIGASEKPGKVGEEGDPDEKRLEVVQEKVNGNGISDIVEVKGCKSPCSEEDKKNATQKSDGSYYTEDEAAKINADNTAALKEAKVETDGGKKSSFSKNSSKLKLGVALLTPAAIATALCVLKDMVKTIATLAKTVRSNQLADFTQLYLSKFDQQKAGDGVDGEMSYFGKVLTTETESGDGTLRAATDSVGYKNAAYGDTNELPSNASPFMVGGGLSGELSNAVKYVDSKLGSGGSAVCSVLLNPIVMGGSIAVSILALIFSGGATATAKALAVVSELAKLGVMYEAFQLIPSLLADMAAGVVIDGTTVGDNAGHALTSGAGSLLGKVAMAGANAPLTPTQSVEYQTLSAHIAAQYAEEDRLAYSPLDATNSNTFMGKIAAWLVPYAAKTSSLSSAVSSMASIITKSFAFIGPQITKAASTDQFTMCKDTEYNELGLGTDVYCNVRFGIPGVENSTDPIEIATDLIDFKDPGTGGNLPLIDEVTGEPSAPLYIGFVNNCINRTAPLVKSDYSLSHDGRKNDGASECMYNESHSVESIDIDACAEPYPDPSPGEVFIKMWTTSGSKTCGSFPNTYQSTYYHFRYLGNSYLYIHMIDMRVESSMDGV
jgi:hypothetical protein